MPQRALVVFGDQLALSDSMSSVWPTRTSFFFWFALLADDDAFRLMLWLLGWIATAEDRQSWVDALSHAAKVPVAHNFAADGALAEDFLWHRRASFPSFPRVLLSVRRDADLRCPDQMLPPLQRAQNRANPPVLPRKCINSLNP